MGVEISECREESSFLRARDAEGARAMDIRELPLVNGASTETSGEQIAVLSPSTGAAIGSVAAADERVVDAAFETARAAQREWARRSIRERSAVLAAVAAEIANGEDELAELLVHEVGKPIGEARGEVGAASSYFSYYASLVTEFRGESLELEHNEELWMRREPRGIVSAILPWNYPAALVARKAAPALAAGNAIIVKPHEETPLTAFWVARAMIRAGVPAGLISILPGRGPEVGQRLVTDPRIDLVTMTGSVRAGKAILAAAAPGLTPVSLELGGKAPLIVMESADIAKAAKAAAFSRFMNNGQVCICAERIFVHESVADQFTSAFIDAARELRVADPLDPASDLGPKVSAAELEKVRAIVDEAVADGAQILFEGELDASLPEGGNWMAPVVIGNVTDDMRLMRDEIFGPVAPITVFSTEAEVIERANDSEYGLSAYLFSQNHSQIMRMVRALESGEVYVNRVGSEDNAGYHAGMKNSGLGGDDGPHGFESYWKKKTVYVHWDESAE